MQRGDSPVPRIGGLNVMIEVMKAGIELGTARTAQRREFAMANVLCMHD